MGALTLGSYIELPDLPGRWQVWSKSDEGPGAYFVVQGGRCATIRATAKKGKPFPEIRVLAAPA